MEPVKVMKTIKREKSCLLAWSILHAIDKDTNFGLRPEIKKKKRKFAIFILFFEII